MKYLLNKAGIQAETVPCRIWDRNDNRTEFISIDVANHSIIRFKMAEGWFYSDPTFDACEPDRYKGEYLFKTKKEMAMLHGLDETQTNIDSPDIRLEKYSERNIAKIIKNIRVKTKNHSKNTSEYKEQPEKKTRLDENSESFRRRMRFEVPQWVQEEIVKKHQQIEQELNQEISENTEHRKIDDVEHGAR